MDFVKKSYIFLPILIPLFRGYCFMKLFQICHKIILLFLICIFISPYVLADDLSPSDDVFDISEILNDIDSIETNSDISQLPTINSRAYVVIDRKSNTILIGKNENQKKKMASTTKIMTALVVIEHCTLSDTVEISKKSASTGGSRLGLKTGDKITVYDLLYGLMMRSGNDAAVALAEHVASSINNFANLMNEKAKTLGLTNTHFVTPHGLDEDEHYTTAYELAILSNYAMNNEIFAKIVGTKNYTITINGYSKNISNTNELLGNLTGVYGVKTGFTNGANRCLVTACKRNNMDIICVVLGADTKRFRTQDSIKLIEYAFKNFTYINANDLAIDYFENWKNENLKYLTINKSSSTSFKLEVKASKTPILSILKNETNDIKTSISIKPNLEAPLYPDSVIGSLTLSISDRNLITLDIINTDTIKKKNIPFYLKLFLSNYSNILEQILK